MRPQPLVCVRDVEVSSRWYRRRPPNRPRLRQLARWAELRAAHLRRAAGAPAPPVGGRAPPRAARRPERSAPGERRAAVVRGGRLRCGGRSGRGARGRGAFAPPPEPAGRRRRPEPLGGLVARPGRLQGGTGQPRWHGGWGLAALTAACCWATQHGAFVLSEATECKQEPGTFRPVIDRAACEGKADCVRVCPVGVFAIGTLPKDMRVGLGIKGTLKGFAHRWQQALLIKGQACEACGKCVSACPEQAITLQRT